MKRKLTTLLSFALIVLSLTACSGGDKPAAQTEADSAPAAQTAVSEFKAADVTSAVLAEIEINSAVEQSSENLANFFDKLDTASLTDSSYYLCASGAYPDEIAFFKFDSADSAKNALDALNERLATRKEQYETYTPEEFYKLEGAVVGQSGSYAYYLVTSDNARAKEIVNGFIGQ